MSVKGWYIFHLFSRVGEVSWVSNWGQLVLDVAGGDIWLMRWFVWLQGWPSRRDLAVCVMAPLAWYLAAFSPPWGFCHCYSQDALWWQHEITCNRAVRSGERTKPKCSLTHLATVAQKQLGGRCRAKVEMVTLGWAPEDVAGPGPPERWGEYGLLSTWAMLSCCCLVIKEAIILAEHPKTVPPASLYPQQSDEMNRAFCHLLKRGKDQNRVHHETTELFMIVYY